MGAVTKVGKKLAKKKSKTLTQVLRKKRKGKYTEASRVEPESGAAYSASPGYGKTTVGKKSIAANEGIVKASMSKTQKAKQKKAAELETKEEKGTITPAQKKWLKNYNKQQEADTLKAQRAARKSRVEKKGKEKGVSLPGSEKIGGRRVGQKTEYTGQNDIFGNPLKLDQYGKPKGNVITESGEVIGNPTGGYEERALRNLEARSANSRTREQNALMAKLRRESTRGTVDRTGALESKVTKRTSTGGSKRRTKKPVKGQKRVMKRIGGNIARKPRGVGVALRGYGGAMRNAR